MPILGTRTGKRSHQNSIWQRQITHLEGLEKTIHLHNLLVRSEVGGVFLNGHDIDLYNFIDRYVEIAEINIRAIAITTPVIAINGVSICRTAIAINAQTTTSEKAMSWR